jgi:hypothetical protein
MLAPGQALYVSGSLPALGAWQPDQMMPLTGEVQLVLHVIFSGSMSDGGLPRTTKPPH